MDSRTGDGRVLGVDACRRGWIAVAVEGAVTGAYFAEDIQALVAQAQADGPLSVVAVDMPIGLADRGQRQADMLARAEIGPLWASVFMTPVREALLAADHATASAINRRLTGHGISIQAFALKPKLLEVEQWARAAAVRVVEVHPEVCFRGLAGFFTAITRTLSLVSWGRNLDAFNDILRGGFGTPEGGFILRWASSAISAERLGWPETIRFIEKMLSTCHPSQIPRVQADLAAARRGQGQTLFDIITSIIRKHGPGGIEAEDNVHLILA